MDFRNMDNKSNRAEWLGEQFAQVIIPREINLTNASNSTLPTPIHAIKHLEASRHHLRQAEVPSVRRTEKQDLCKACPHCWAHCWEIFPAWRCWDWAQEDRSRSSLWTRTPCTHSQPSLPGCAPSSSTGFFFGTKTLEASGFKLIKPERHPGLTVTQ